MAVLSRALLPRARNRAALALLIALLFAAGCILVDALEPSEPSFAFSHRVHVTDQKLECADCHASWDAAEDPGMPLSAQCALCHSDLDAEKPPERKVATLFADGGYLATGAGRQSDEILFSHEAHATRSDCTACHADVVGSHAAGATLPMSMDTCLACHDASTGPKLTECAACHVEIRDGVAPPSHAASWTRYHGTVVRARPSGRADQCALCHQTSECTNCHHVELPANHNNFWRRRGHGLTASMDRESCATCHDSDSCQRCHDEMQPQSHVGAFGAPQDRHCLACHEPLRSVSCGVCHAATPSHDLATPLPPDHNPGMNCRMCHGNGVALPHVDNGQTCTSCHQ